MSREGAFESFVRLGKVTPEIAMKMLKSTALVVHPVYIVLLISSAVSQQ